MQLHVAFYAAQQLAWRWRQGYGLAAPPAGTSCCCGKACPTSMIRQHLSMPTNWLALFSAHTHSLVNLPALCRSLLDFSWP